MVKKTKLSFKKGFNLVFLALLVFVVAVGVVFAQQSQDIRSRASFAAYVDPSKCVAGSITALQTCIGKLENKQVTKIEITNRIYCNATYPCVVKITGVDQGQIFGTPGSDAGFIRTGKYDYVIFTIDQSSNITISGLTFDDNKISPFCTYAEYTKKCKPQMAVFNSNNIVFDGVKFLNSKSQAITLSAVSNFTFNKSEIANTYVQGLWMAKAPNDTQGATITNSSFHETGGSSLFLSGKNMVVKNNVFSHNQWNPPWLIQGGQINIFNVQNLLIEGNEIANGKYDSAPWHFTAGIEFNGSLLNQGVTIRNNNIHNNSGWGVVGGVETGITAMKDVLVEGNTFKQNGAPAIYDLSQRNDWTVRKNTCDGSPCAEITHKLFITKAGLSKTWSPWAVWALVTNLKKGVLARLLYNGNQWGGDILTAQNADGVSFQLPSNMGPSSCNKNGDCKIQLKLVDPATGETSNEYTLTLPKP